MNSFDLIQSHPNQRTLTTFAKLKTFSLIKVSASLRTMPHTLGTPLHRTCSNHGLHAGSPVEITTSASTGVGRSQVDNATSRQAAVVLPTA